MKIRLMESERNGMERKNPNLGELEWSLAPTLTQPRGGGLVGMLLPVWVIDI
jgi:hypothetical protein